MFPISKNSQLFIYFYGQSKTNDSSSTHCVSQYSNPLFKESVSLDFLTSKSKPNSKIIRPDYQWPGWVRIMKKMEDENLVTHSL